MTERIFYLKSTDEDHKLFCVEWYEETIPQRAVLQIAHGMTEHIKRYQTFGRAMAKLGIIVVGHDHLGHGKSVKNIGEHGHFHDKDGKKHLLMDMEKIGHYIEKKYVGLPRFLLGHSMGSFCTRAYLRMYGKNHLDGIILMGSGDVPFSQTLAGQKLVQILKLKYGIYHRSPFVESILFHDYTKGISPLHTKKDWLSRDEDVVQKYLADPSCNFLFTLGAYGDFLGILELSAKTLDARHIPLDLPIFIISGEEDPVGAWGRGVKKLYETYQKTGFSDVEMILYEGARHEILNETNKEEVFSDVAGWILRRVSEISLTNLEKQTKLD
ncbi:MAG: alpha/beta hydrolase [Bacillota bacterium]